MKHLYTLQNIIRVGYFYKKITEITSTLISNLLPQGCSVLDIGCGDGNISKLVFDKANLSKIHGLELSVRDKSYIDIDVFDGKNIPFSSNSFDYVMFVDVLHHTNDQLILLNEAKRLCRQGLIIKDRSHSFKNRRSANRYF